MVKFLLRLESLVRRWRERFDRCHICGEPADYWCESCRKRMCLEHEHFLEDCSLCDNCVEVEVIDNTGVAT